MYNFILENELHTIGTNKIITPALPYYQDQKNPFHYILCNGILL